MRRIFFALFAALTLAVAGCSAESGSPAESASTPIVIDVRTPAEFAEGHLDGALNLDVAADDFEERVTALDQADTYVVYCRSGNRSADAVATMGGLGFTDVTDAGGLQAAAESTGLDIVRN